MQGNRTKILIPVIDYYIKIFISHIIITIIWEIYKNSIDKVFCMMFYIFFFQ